MNSEIDIDSITIHKGSHVSPDRVAKRMGAAMAWLDAFDVTIKPDAAFAALEPGAQLEKLTEGGAIMLAMQLAGLVIVESPTAVEPTEVA